MLQTGAIMKPSNRGFTLLETVLALSIGAFILLALLRLECTSLHQLSADAHKGQDYSKLLDWKPEDLGQASCSTSHGQLGISLLRCNRRSDLLGKESTFTVVSD